MVYVKNLLIKILFGFVSMKIQSDNRRALDARYKLILPTPLFEYSNEFIRINDILSSSHVISDQLQILIKECMTKQDSSYCFIIWFIHYYTRFFINNVLPDEQFVKLIKDDLHNELITCFTSIGYRLILSLCKNFNEKSYFHLKPTINEEDVHQRLIVLNIIALLLSCKSLESVSYLSFLLFNENHQIPHNYTEHFKQFNTLIGITPSNDNALIQMINIRTQINEQMKNDRVNLSNYSIIRCSSNCPWILYFKTCELSNEQKQCPLCKKELNYSQNEDISEILKFISQYIEQYDNCESIIENRHHLTQPISYHFINLLIHSIFLVLNDLDFMSYSSQVNCNYFQKYIKHDYVLLRQHLFNIDQCYIWIYKLINHMANKSFYNQRRA